MNVLLMHIHTYSVHRTEIVGALDLCMFTLGRYYQFFKLVIPMCTSMSNI